jgi:hypothetical protein
VLEARRILDRDGLFDFKTAVAIREDNLLESGQSMESTPYSLGLDSTSVATSRDIKGVGLINTSLKISLEISNNNIDSLQGMLSSTFGVGWESGIFDRRSLDNLRNILFLPD